MGNEKPINEVGPSLIGCRLPVERFHLWRAEPKVRTPRRRSSMLELPKEPTRRRAIRARWRVGLAVGMLVLPGAVLADAGSSGHPAARQDAVAHGTDAMGDVAWIWSGRYRGVLADRVGRAGLWRPDRFHDGGRLGGAAVALAGILDQVVKNSSVGLAPAPRPRSVFGRVSLFPAPMRRPHSRRAMRQRRSRWQRCSRCGARDGPRRVSAGCARGVVSDRSGAPFPLGRPRRGPPGGCSGLGLLSFGPGWKM